MRPPGSEFRYMPNHSPNYLHAQRCEQLNQSSLHWLLSLRSSPSSSPTFPIPHARPGTPTPTPRYRSATVPHQGHVLFRPYDDWNPGPRGQQRLSSVTPRVPISRLRHTKVSTSTHRQLGRGSEEPYINRSRSAYIPQHVHELQGLNHGFHHTPPRVDHYSTTSLDLHTPSHAQFPPTPAEPRRRGDRREQEAPLTLTPISRSASTPQYLHHRRNRHQEQILDNHTYSPREHGFQEPQQQRRYHTHPRRATATSPINVNQDLIESRIQNHQWFPAAPLDDIRRCESPPIVYAEILEPGDWFTRTENPPPLLRGGYHVVETPGVRPSPSYIDPSPEYISPTSNYREDEDEDEEWEDYQSPTPSPVSPHISSPRFSPISPISNTTNAHHTHQNPLEIPPPPYSATESITETLPAYIDVPRLPGLRCYTNYHRYHRHLQEMNQLAGEEREMAMDREREREREEASERARERKRKCKECCGRVWRRVRGIFGVGGRGRGDTVSVTPRPVTPMRDDVIGLGTMMNGEVEEYRVGFRWLW